MKPYPQISMNFGLEEPLTPGISESLQEPAQTIHTVKPAIAPVKIPVADETTILTIRKKPGRKEKEKVWKSAGPGKRGRKSLKDITAEADLIEIPEDEILFSKQYYSIGEVANMFHMNPSLIRTWSNEFEGMLQPRKNRKGDRFFRPDDVKFLNLIYHLIRVRKFTLEGAREHLKLQKKKTEKQFTIIQSLQQFKSFLLELKSNL
jgi:DNA-binding transcriptional MerR regulator